MKIAYKDKAVTLFENIKVGDVFFKDVLWLKVNFPNFAINAVDIETGLGTFFATYTEVERVNATLTVER